MSLADIVFKVIVIGDPTVGKTSLIQRYVNNEYRPNYKGTIGVDFAVKVITMRDNRRVKLQLWDIAGQERFTSMTRVYYKDADACIVMFDLTKRKSFLGSIRWKQDLDGKCLTQDGVEVPCLLLANKVFVGGGLRTIYNALHPVDGNYILTDAALFTKRREITRPENVFLLTRYRVDGSLLVTDAHSITDSKKCVPVDAIQSSRWKLRSDRRSCIYRLKKSRNDSKNVFMVYIARLVIYITSLLISYLFTEYSF